MSVGGRVASWPNERSEIPVSCIRVGINSGLFPRRGAEETARKREKQIRERGSAWPARYIQSCDPEQTRDRTRRRRAGDRPPQDPSHLFRPGRLAEESGHRREATYIKGKTLELSTWGDIAPCQLRRDFAPEAGRARRASRKCVEFYLDHRPSLRRGRFMIVLGVGMAPPRERAGRMETAARKSTVDETGILCDLSARCSASYEPHVFGNQRFFPPDSSSFEISFQMKG
jgi:hypothetical protein